VSIFLSLCLILLGIAALIPYLLIHRLRRVQGELICGYFWWSESKREAFKLAVYRSLTPAGWDGTVDQVARIRNIDREEARRRMEEEFFRAEQRAGVRRANLRQAQRTAQKVLDLWAILLPTRIANEDLGDYLEDIHRLSAAGQSRWIIYLRCVVAVFWTGANTVGYFWKAIGKTKSTD